jgi:6-pyruvoyl-tetrahydropterin synthase
MTYAVEVSDHIMVAHSLPGEIFGPAQRVHGATYVVRVALYRDELDSDRIVVDIGRSTTILRDILGRIDYRNLDEVEEFAGQLTTTEFLCRWIFDQFKGALTSGEFGPNAAGIKRGRVTLIETPTARAWYEGDIALG